MDKAVRPAIQCIWDHYSEPLSLADIANSALLSRFYFARLFREATGVTPGRFLAAVRIYQAKRLLLTTSMTITNIAFAVGYSSLGSFTNYFTESVGLSPGRFRRVAQDGGFEFVPPRKLATNYGAVAGAFALPDGYADARVYVGAFTSSIVQYRPAAASVVDVSAESPRSYLLQDVPAGTWYIHAVAVADTAAPEPWTRRTSLVGGHVSVTVRDGAITRTDISLRVSQPMDPPILLALPNLEPRSSGRKRAAPRTTGSARTAASARGAVIRHPALTRPPHRR